MKKPVSHAAGLHRASLGKLHDLDAALELMRGGRVGVAYWPVLQGPMLRIFVIDAVLFAANLVAALLLVARS